MKLKTFKKIFLFAGPLLLSVLGAILILPINLALRLADVENAQLEYSTLPRSFFV